MNESKAMLELADRIKVCREKRIYDVGLSGDEKLLIESALRASAPQEDGRALEPVRRIEMVRQVGIYEEPADPEWRLEIGGVCADFPTETWANNFRNAVLSLLSAPPSVALEARETRLIAALKTARAALDNPASLTSRERAYEAIGAALTRPQPGGAVATKSWDMALADRIQQLADAGCPSLSCVQMLGLIAFVRDGEGAAPGGAVAGTERGEG